MSYVKSCVQYSDDKHIWKERLKYTGSYVQIEDDNGSKRNSFHYTAAVYLWIVGHRGFENCPTKSVSGFELSVDADFKA